MDRCVDGRHLRRWNRAIRAVASKAPFKFGQHRAARIPAMRQSVPLDRCPRLLNHGPTVLVSAEHAGRRNVMAAAWSMPLDFTPPKVAVVLDKQTFTRTLIEGSGAFVLAVPSVAIAALTDHVGSTSGRDSEKFTEALASAEPGQPT